MAITDWSHDATLVPLDNIFLYFNLCHITLFCIFPFHSIFVKGTNDGLKEQHQFLDCKSSRTRRHLPCAQIKGQMVLDNWRISLLHWSSSKGSLNIIAPATSVRNSNDFLLSSPHVPLQALELTRSRSSRGHHRKAVVQCALELVVTLYAAPSSSSLAKKPLTSSCNSSAKRSCVLMHQAWKNCH